ncbi:MAG: glutamate-5-semialdehyde dehydrogenase [Planctomycetaceae bacterium]
MSAPAEYAAELAVRARAASRLLAAASGAQKNRWLAVAADLLLNRQQDVIRANSQDIAAAPEYGLTKAEIDRLALTPKRIADMAAALREVIALTDPIGEVIEGYVRPNGLNITRVRVPLGVVLFIYESRPNVTLDAAALCVKSGNAVVLRGGKEALHSNLALYRILQEALRSVQLPEQAVQLVESTDRDIVGALLKQRGLIDVAIPRGGKSLIERVAQEATMPVIKHFDGICHIYLDETADAEMALSILKNAKCQRPGVCNAAETVLIHRCLVESFLPKLDRMFAAENVEIRGCPLTRQWIPRAQPATDDDYRTEYLDLIISAKVVEDLTAAIAHIETYGSHHTDAIITRDYASAERFLNEVDLRGGAGQCQHAVQRRRRTRARGRNRHQHRPIPRPWPLRAPGTDQL